jgi:hypothetical protein
MSGEATTLKDGRNNYVLVVFDSCRYDSFTAARPKPIGRLGRIARSWSYASWTGPRITTRSLMGEAPRAEPYDIAKDPHELPNIIRANSAEAGTLRAELSKLLARYTLSGKTPLPDTSGQTRTALKSVGYLAATQRGKSANEGPELEGSAARVSAFREALDSFYAQRLNEAIAGFRPRAGHGSAQLTGARQPRRSLATFRRKIRFLD